MPESPKQYDIVLLTEPRYIRPRDVSPLYIRSTGGSIFVGNVLKEDELVRKALEKKGFRVTRKSWDDAGFDWKSTEYILFRTTWDYFERYPEFSEWLINVSELTRMLNPYAIIQWNVDKHYLLDLQAAGCNIPETIYIEAGERRSLKEIADTTGWEEMILKPCISGGARNTYRLNRESLKTHEIIFRKLISMEAMMLQNFQINVLKDGEAALMVFGGKYSHAIIKKVKPGDFRVQDDFGGSVHPYEASVEEIGFAEICVAACNPVPVYARVDIIRDNEGMICVSELELIEPEMWFRFYPDSAGRFASAVANYISFPGS